MRADTLNSVMPEINQNSNNSEHTEVQETNIFEINSSRDEQYNYQVHIYNEDNTWYDNWNGKSHYNYDVYGMLTSTPLQVQTLHPQMH